MSGDLELGLDYERAPAGGWVVFHAGRQVGRAIRNGRRWDAVWDATGKTLPGGPWATRQAAAVALAEAFFAPLEDDGG